MTDVNAEQQAALDEIRREVASIEATADDRHARAVQALKSGKMKVLDFNKELDEIIAMDEEARLKGLIAYMPAAGEKKTGKIMKLAEKAFGKREKKDDREARIKTLEFVNEWRVSLGVPELDALPMSIPGNSHECVIARAIVMDTDGRFIDPSVGGSGAIKMWDTVSRTFISPDLPITVKEVRAYMDRRGCSSDVPTELYEEAAKQEKYHFLDTVVTEFDTGGYADVSQANGLTWFDVAWDLCGEVALNLEDVCIMLNDLDLKTENGRRISLYRGDDGALIDSYTEAEVAPDMLYEAAGKPYPELAAG